MNANVFAVCRVHSVVVTEPATREAMLRNCWALVSVRLASRVPSVTRAVLDFLVIRCVAPATAPVRAVALVTPPRVYVSATQDFPVPIAVLVGVQLGLAFSTMCV